MSQRIVLVWTPHSREVKCIESGNNWKHLPNEAGFEAHLFPQSAFFERQYLQHQSWPNRRRYMGGNQPDGVMRLASCDAKPDRCWTRRVQGTEQYGTWYNMESARDQWRFSWLQDCTFLATLPNKARIGWFAKRIVN